MARFRSLLMSEIRGSIAGATFSRNGNSAYMRARSTPVNPRTPAQTQARNVLGYISALWRSLTTGQMTAWKALAVQIPYTNSLGETSFYSGFQLFMKCNMVIRGLFGQTVLDAPSAPPTFPSVVFGGFIAEQDAISFETFNVLTTVALTGSGTGFAVEHQATAVTSAGRNFINQSEYRQILVVNPVVNANPQALATAYTDVYGVPSVSLIGDAIFLRSRLVHTASGLTSPWVEQRTLVAEA